MSVALVMGMIILAIPQVNIVYESFNLFSVYTTTFWKVFWSLLAGGFTLLSLLEQLTFIALCIVVGINVMIFITYLKQYRTTVRRSGGTLTIVGMIAAILGTGCLSCSVLLIGPLISLLGVSTSVWLIQNSIFMSLLGLLLVVFSTYLLLKKLVNPAICIPVYE